MVFLRRLLVSASFGFSLSFSLVFSFGVVTAGSGFAGENPESRVTKPAAALNLDQLLAVQNLLRVELDGTSVCPKEFSVLGGAGRAGLSQLLEAEVQSKLGKMRAANALVSYLSEAKRVSLCEARCRCEAYTDALGKPVGPKKSRALTNTDYAKCAKANAAWICPSEVLKALISEGKDVESSGS